MSGEIVPFTKRHGHTSGRAGTGRDAKTSNVISYRRLRLASLTKATQREDGMPRSRQVLTVEGGQESAAARPPVPPSKSITSSTVIMDPLIVRSLRTCQGFAVGETTSPDGHAPIVAMIDRPEIVAARLRRLRQACGFKTQTAFAKAIGVEKNTYNPWEKGTRELTFEGACLIRKRFHIPVDYLFWGDLQDEIPARILKQIQDAA